MKISRDYHEVDLLMPWSIVIGVVFFVVFLYFVWLIQFDIFRNPDIVTDNHLRILLFLIALFIAIQIVHIINRFLARHINRTYQARFHHLKDIASYTESKNKIFFVEKKYAHAVLLLHSFSSSSHAFRFVTPHLREKGLNYYAPNLLGFGLDNTLLLNNTRKSDWYREALDAYDYLSSIAEKVSIVGHSLGGLLAGYIASMRHVHNLVLVAPGFYLNKPYKRHKMILTMPIISALYITLFPYLPKPLDRERGHVADVLDKDATRDMFHYLAIPVTSVRELFKMQDESHPEKMRAHKISIIYGQHEKTVDMIHLFKTLDVCNIPYDMYCLEKSAHSPLEDFDREDCCKIITDIFEQS